MDLASKKYETTYFKNKEMDNQVYEQRTKVMNCIRELKKIVPELPRITVRITENGIGEHISILGAGRLNKNIIWIAHKTINSPDLYLVVAHEIIHAVLGKDHDESCPLMKSHLTKSLSNETVNQIFKEYFLKYSNV